MTDTVKKTKKTRKPRVKKETVKTTTTTTAVETKVECSCKKAKTDNFFSKALRFLGL